ncbi:MAG: hypothetical protein LBJ12_09240 [Oscillospiraceae bacterium]|jgi:DNA repair ATPase RecN|nr:hypothetical protein [Oscillospiraceae bacterium]
MKISMRLLKLTLLGSRKNYVVEFKAGLNYISGHTSTGKTSVLEMIDYALGSKEHKSYIEIGQSCSAVELELAIGSEQFLFRRKLFSFTEPMVIEQWDSEKGKYSFYTRCDVDAPSNPNSLSAFLLEKFNLADVTIIQDRFSFRDLFKYSYLKQTEIDNEDIMRESDWVRNAKRKATFEIIFNLFDATLDNYKKTLKNKEDEYKNLEIRLQGIKDFLITAELSDMQEYVKQANALRTDIERLKGELSAVKQDKGINTDFANSLRQRIIAMKEQLSIIAGEKADQHDYLNRLRLLKNQYDSEIEKRQMAKDGYFVFSQYEFAFCPNCLRPIAQHNAQEICCLCGSSRSDSSSELLVIEKEIKQIKRKLNEILKFIESEDKKLDNISVRERQSKQALSEAEQELQHLYADYDNPRLEQIELLNYEIGNRMRLQYELEQKLKMIEELEGIEKYLKDKGSTLENLKTMIRDLSKVTPDKETLIRGITTRFTKILEAFSYPKLSNSYVDDKTYLPYVRGNKYNDIGSLAGVSLITMAYYLAVLLEGITDDYHHLNILMIDSPRKNLGAKANADTDEEFKDEKIFDAIIKLFTQIGKEYEDRLQLIVVNNGYPDFLPADCVVAEFDTERDNLPNGLIDDAV